VIIHKKRLEYKRIVAYFTLQNVNITTKVLANVLNINIDLFV